MAGDKRPCPYLKCTRCGADIELGSRHKVVAKTEGGRNHCGDTTWSTDETAYLCDECHRRMINALAWGGSDERAHLCD